MNRLQAAEQLRKALQKFANSLTDEEAMEVPAVFDAWEPGKAYKGGEFFVYGVNNVGDPQLYKVNEGKDHISQADWIPGVEKSLYTAIGLDDSGYPIWACLAIRATAKISRAATEVIFSGIACLGIGICSFPAVQSQRSKARAGLSP